MKNHSRTRSLGRRLAEGPIFGLSLGVLIGSAGAAAAAPALPAGGAVQAGSAAIGARAGATLAVRQSSSKAIIDWSSFSIGQGGTVQFENGSGATLNRVTGSNISSIDGLLSATGSVYLINPNGVIVGKSGVINTGGSFVASTLDVANASFLAGGPLAFSGPSTASVVNLGKVGSLGGNVAMIATTVNNAGSIAAPKGDVGLIAGTTVTMDDADNDAGGLFSVKVGGPSTSATNSGAIAAAAVELRAQQGNVYALAGNTGGVINATGVDASGGMIKLISEGGTTTVAGTLDAQGPSGTGGRIETSGQRLNLGAASVDTHGGAWLLDPTDLIINATAAGAIDTALASGDVTLATSASSAPTETGVTGAVGDTASGNGDIIVASALTWSSASTLTLNAHAALIVEAPISVTGAGKVALAFNTAAADAPGGLSFDLGPSRFAGSLSFAVGSGSGVVGQALTINGTSYTLLYSMSGVAGINGSSSHYALAAPITAATTYASAVAASFSGTLEGLGNTVTGLTIDGGSNSEVGLIGTLGSGGGVRDLGLVRGSVSGSSYVGGLVGKSAGTVGTSYATSAVSGTASYVGGLVGANGGSVEMSYATGAVVGTGIVDVGVSSAGGDVGGLVGLNFEAGTVETSYATGAVSGSSYVGGLVGYNNKSTVEASYATGKVSGTGVFIGGLVGFNNGDTVETSYATGAVSGTHNVGGLVGYNYGDGAIEASYATGVVLGTSDVGGLVGENQTGGAIEASHATGAVSGSSYVGGLAGLNSSIATVETSYATGAVSGTSYYVGGLIGGNSGAIETSYATGTVSGINGTVGGLVGINHDTIETSYATGAASGGNTVGGLVGSNYGTVETSYATGRVSSSGDDVGGLLGLNVAGTVKTSYATGAVSSTATNASVGGLVGVNVDGTIETSYATGAVSRTGTFVGGLIGDNSSGTLTSSYWDTQTTGQSLGVGGDVGGGMVSAIGLTSAQFATASSFVGWSFGATPGAAGWVIIDADGSLNNAGGAAGGTRPLLLSEYSTTIVNGHQLELVNLDRSTSYTLGADIDLTPEITDRSGVWFASSNAPAAGYGFAPIGNATTPFTGSLNGQGYKIDGLVIDRLSTDHVGLFGVIGAAGSVSNVSLIGGWVAGSSGVGELAGVDYGDIANSYATGAVSGRHYVGGLVGDESWGGDISQSYATGAVSGDLDVGGVIGLQHAGDLFDAYATGAVSGPVNAGGLIGDQYAGSVTDTYAAGAVSGTTDAGGLIGDQSAHGSVTASYWDTQATGQSVGVGENAGGTFSATGLTTAQMQHATSYSTTYSGWNFTTIWYPPSHSGVASYPQLRP